ncbi:MAG: hypothetical protein ISR95_08670 [Candidatus Marinimicrobia bacterium]|nr:hypothetical protein [Candidatus Brocadiales bacterium]MBL7047681.1 hypothetical protein [Candidatus Neomarinimicrobiota bacterium]
MKNRESILISLTVWIIILIFGCSYIETMKNSINTDKIHSFRIQFLRDMDREILILVDTTNYNFKNIPDMTKAYKKIIDQVVNKLDAKDVISVEFFDGFLSSSISDLLRASPYYGWGEYRGQLRPGKGDQFEEADKRRLRQYEGDNKEEILRLLRQVGDGDEFEPDLLNHILCVAPQYDKVYAVQARSRFANMSCTEGPDELEVQDYLSGLIITPITMVWADECLRFAPDGDDIKEKSVNVINAILEHASDTKFDFELINTPEYSDILNEQLIDYFVEDFLISRKGGFRRYMNSADRVYEYNPLVVDWILSNLMTLSPAQTHYPLTVESAKDKIEVINELDNPEKYSDVLEWLEIFIRADNR